ncbi:hypothetical protein [Alicyclobacillus fastidiosus]|uniref:Uncharacterized protein n=1 Tax=Alicyclobacillus fastidiosus TaxID=392011 RepID=A0ABV5AKY0_9BACL
MSSLLIFDELRGMQLTNVLELSQIHNRLVSIMHSMTNDDGYTAADVFNDIFKVAQQLREALDLTVIQQKVGVTVD